MPLPLFRTKMCQIIFRPAYAVSRKSWGGIRISDFDPERKIAVSDTHRANLILMSDGHLAPIDLRVQPIFGSLLDTVANLCSNRLPNH